MIALLLVLALLALIVGLGTALKWLIIVALVLAAVAIVRGFMGTNRSDL